MNRIIVASLVAGLPALLASCVVAERPAFMHEARVVAAEPDANGEVIVTEEPPPPLEEVVTVSPGPLYCWVPGYWDWHGGWVWVRGSWMVGPRPGARWVSGTWAPYPRGYRRVGGHWR